MFRSRTGQIGSIATAVLAALLLGMIWYSDGVVFALRTAPILVGLAFLTWWVWGWPTLTLAHDGVRVQNQFMTYKLSWGALVDTEVRFGLYLMVAPTSSVATAQREPGDLADLVSVYVAAVPAQGGFKASRRRQPVTPPPITAGAGDTQVLMIPPSAAARIVDEQKLLVTDSRAAADSDAGNEVAALAPVSFTKTFNWVPAAIFTATVLLSIVLWPYSGTWL